MLLFRTSHHRSSCLWVKNVTKGLALLVLLTLMIRPPLEVAGKLEGRRCRSSLSDQGLTLVEQLHQTVCKPCFPTVTTQSEMNVIVDRSTAPAVSQTNQQPAFEESSTSSTAAMVSIPTTTSTPNETTQNASDSSTVVATKHVFNTITSSGGGGDSRHPNTNLNQCNSGGGGAFHSNNTTKKAPEKERYHVVVLLMGMARMEKALVLMAELIDRDHHVTVVTTQQMSITNHLHDILRQHIPCQKNVMDFLHVEAFNMNEAWPCQPDPTPSLDSAVNTENNAHHSFYHNARLHHPDHSSNNPLDASMPLHCNAHHASFLMRKLLRIVTRMNKRPDVIVADSTLLAGLLVAEASKLPCLAIVPDDLTPSNPSSTLKWTHPAIYRQLQDNQKSETINFAVALRQSLEQWWREWQDQLSMTTAFMTYNNVRRKLHLPPRYQILDFWKTVVLWTSLTRHLPDPPQGNPRVNDTTENDSIMVDFKAYLYSKTGIGIGTSASKGNSLPLLSLPEPSVPPCQPCEVPEKSKHEKSQRLLEVDTSNYNNGTCHSTPQEEEQPDEEEEVIEEVREEDDEEPGSDQAVQILVPYYSYAKTLPDRQKFRKLMRAMVLLRDSLLAWPKCPQTRSEMIADADADAGEAFVPLVDCWPRVAEFMDFQLIRLGNSYEAFVPSILQHDLSPFLDSVANHKSIVALILPDCKTSASSQWMQDLGFPSLCLPEGDNWNVRTIALKMGRLLRRIVQAKQTGEDFSTLTISVSGSDNSSSSTRDLKEKPKRNGHTLYGTTMGNIADVIEIMASTKRESQRDWITGDDMAWDVWLRLGLVRRPSSLNNTDTWSGGFKSCLVVLSWVLLVAAVLYLIFKDNSSLFSSCYSPTTGFTRRRRNTLSNSSNNNNQQEGGTTSADASAPGASILTYFYWPTFILMRTDMIQDVWTAVVDEFLERVPDLDRLYDMWKEWAAEESEQMNLLFYGWFDKPEESNATITTNPNISATLRHHRSLELQHHHHPLNHHSISNTNNNNDSSNHVPQSRKRRTKRK